MKVLLTGAEGQLGRALQSSVRAGVTLVATGRATLDLANPQSIAQVVKRERPDVVVNAAAYTAVDRAEAESEAAFLVNAAGVGNLARACASVGSALVHLSTDFVFDGAQGRPYATHDLPAPLNVYGASKLAGERELAAVPDLQWSVIRTAWVYAPWGRNFALTMLRVLRERRVATVVADQIGTPTSVFTLAQAVWAACERPAPGQVLHFTDAGVASWYDFAVAIGEEATARGLLDGGWSVRPIVAADYPTPARRPAFSVLDKHESWRQLGLEPMHWRAALRRTLEEVSR